MNMLSRVGDNVDEFVDKGCLGSKLQLSTCG